jgi:hypothetical protein
MTEPITGNHREVGEEEAIELYVGPPPATSPAHRPFWLESIRRLRYIRTQTNDRLPAAASTARRDTALFSVLHLIHMMPKGIISSSQPLPPPLVFYTKNARPGTVPPPPQSRYKAPVRSRRVESLGCSETGRRASKPRIPTATELWAKNIRVEWDRNIKSTLRGVIAHRRDSEHGRSYPTSGRAESYHRSRKARMLQKISRGPRVRYKSIQCRSTYLSSNYISAPKL